MIVSHAMSVWLAAAIFLGILVITGVVLPWKFARYEECDRRGGWTKGLLLAVVTLVSIVTLFYSWTNWWGARKLSAALAVLREKNEPTRFEEIVPAPVPDADNAAAAPVFQEVFFSAKDSRLGKLEIPWKKIAGKPESGESTIHFTARFLNPDFKGDDQAAGELVLKSLAPSAPLLEEVAQAVRRPGVCWQIDYSKGFETLLPHLPAMTNTSKVLQGRAQAELAAGRPENAFQDVQTLLALARAAGSSPFLITVLVESSISDRASQVINDGLERHAWTDAQLEDLSSELSRIDLLARLSDSLRGERASLLQLDASRTDLLTLQGLPDTRTLRLQNAALRATWAIWPAGWFNEDKAGYIGTIQRYIDAVNHPKELPPTLTEIESARAASSVWNKIRNPLSHKAMPVLMSPTKRIAATQTILRSLATACAVERYRMAHGRLPATLEDLVPAFLLSVPTDPLTGKPLCYKPSESSSYLIYGTGWDQTDNAGSSVTALNDSKKFADQADWGVLVKF
ncbi:MAG: hypothetical protein NTZ08_08185 [Verrucomicrobia bacterium]|nr:hypothetical protein [Verrucomicrobiota bacterium]